MGRQIEASKPSVMIVDDGQTDKAQQLQMRFTYIKVNTTKNVRRWASQTENTGLDQSVLRTGINFNPSMNK